MQDINQTMMHDGDVEACFNFDEKSIRKGFVRKVYGILTCQLLLTLGIMALFIFHKPTQVWAESVPWLLFGAMGVYFVVVIIMLCCTNARRKTPMNFIFLAIFTVATGIMLGLISMSLNVDVVLIAVGTTAAIVLSLTLFALQTKWDFTTLGGVLLSLTIGLFVFGILAISLGLNDLKVVYASLGAILFSLYIVYDTQLMLGGEHKYAISPEEYIFAALNLYLDIINLFLYILQIIASSR